MAAACIPRFQMPLLGVAAGAFSLFVETFLSEIPCACFALSLQDMERWAHNPGDRGGGGGGGARPSRLNSAADSGEGYAKLTGEAGCREHFTVIRKDKMGGHMVPGAPLSKQQ